MSYLELQPSDANTGSEPSLRRSKSLLPVTATTTTTPGGRASERALVTQLARHVALFAHCRGT